MPRLRIAVTVDPYLPVPPEHYGGIERVVDFLVRRLTARGHRVTLYAHPGSQTPAELVPYGTAAHFSPTARARELCQVARGLWSRRQAFDLIHSFGRLAALLPVLPLRSLPKIQSYQRDRVPWQSIKVAVGLAGRSIRFTGCSSSVYRERPAQGPCGGVWHTVFNGVDLAKYTLVPKVPRNAPLVFLGRLEPIKGVHHAIAVARATGRRLIIAGNRPETEAGIEYFDREVAPHLDGQAITYLGPVDDDQKNHLLGRAAALLMLVEWEEPFGIVMAEALACGTPVIGFARGSVPEVVRHAVNGFSCASVAEVIEAIRRLPAIDRVAVRKDCEQRFSDRAIVDVYEQLYREMVETRHA